MVKEANLNLADLLKASKKKIPIVQSKVNKIRKGKNSKSQKVKQGKIANKVMKQDMIKWLPLIHIQENKQHLDLTLSNDQYRSTNYDPYKNSSILQTQILRKTNLRTQEQVRQQESKLKLSKQNVKLLERHKNLLFYDQLKKKRQAKIKSKKYHKRQRKNLSKLDLDVDQEAQSKNEKRIEQRIRLRHAIKGKYINKISRFRDKRQLQQSINKLQRIKKKLVESYKPEQIEQQSDQQLIQEVQQKIKQWKEQWSEQQQEVEQRNGRRIFGSKNDQKVELKSKSRGVDKDKDVEGQRSLQRQGKLLKGIDIGKYKAKFNKNQNLNLNMDKFVAQNKDLFQDLAIITNTQNHQDFLNQKNQLIASQLQKNKEPQLKGWGSWTGPGIQNKKVDQKKQLQKKMKQIELIKKQRRDGKVQNIIINQKKTKPVNESYQQRDLFISKLPHKYQSAQQFNYLHSKALGPQWNSMSSFKKNIKPVIIKSKGKQIKGIKLPQQVQRQLQCIQ